MAERGRFELPVTCATPLFESGTINHSDTSPRESVASRDGSKEFTIHDRSVRGTEPARRGFVFQPLDRLQPSERLTHEQK